MTIRDPLKTTLRPEVPEARILPVEEQADVPQGEGALASYGGGADRAIRSWA